ncbi:MAG: GGDEF domain-containing protein, partial [Bradyrhizobium sp.]
GFFEAAGLVMGRNRKSAAPVSVLAFDLDHFKSVNDRYGHAVGDAVLQLFARVVRETMRADDVIGRLGGEEFVAVLPGGLKDAAAAGERVRSALAAASIVRNGQRIAATVSIGVASGSPLGAVDSLITRADEALYRAKSGGRNRVEMADEIVETHAETRAARAVRSAVRVKEKGAALNGALEGCIA